MLKKMFFIGRTDGCSTQNYSSEPHNIEQKKIIPMRFGLRIVKLVNTGCTGRGQKRKFVTLTHWQKGVKMGKSQRKFD